MTAFGALLAMAAGVLLACASDADRQEAAETPAASEAGQVVEITGRVVVTGSDPLVALVVVTETNEQYELVGERAEPLWDLQQRQVTVRGRIVQQALGPGFPAQLEVDSYTIADPAAAAVDAGQRAAALWPRYAASQQVMEFPWDN